MVRGSNLLKPFLFHPAFKDRGEGLQERAISFLDFAIEARHDIEARSLGLSKIETDDRNIFTKDFALGLDVISQFFNLVIRLFNCLGERIMELVGLLQDKGPIEVLLVLEKVVKRSDSKLGLLGDFVHGDVVVSLLREKLECRSKHLLRLHYFFSF